MVIIERDFRSKLIENARKEVQISRESKTIKTTFRPQSIIVEDKQIEIEKSHAELRKKYADLLSR